ncbi:cache domain-containing protein [Nitrosospira briensis]|uniref:cache domain-containing protein n=1 Tax=Nitrosospira briensis TaxID=35799 RepID=UPI0008DF3768|nr:cache domain-containing protein [Nitrosospira briensis]SFO03870.1 two-component system, NarL family, sensor kinase [Nitrosospira briensis]
MNLRQKIILFAVLPMMLALCAIALTVRHHAISLSQQQREVIKPAYLAMKDAELKNYVEYANRIITHLQETSRTDAEAKEKAKAFLEKMDDGKDSYFFVYDLQGTLLAHPKHGESVGESLWELQDSTGKFIIQDLIRIAREGSGYETYVWPKFSTGSSDPKPKRAYVTAVPEWRWMIGTGVYLDDVDKALAEIDSQVSRNIENTMFWIAGIAFLAAVVIFLGLISNIRERTVLDDRLGEANTNLAVLTQRLIIARKEESERIRNLHDGIQSMLTAIKMNIEIALFKLPKTSQLSRECAPFKSAAKLLGGTLGDLRKIIKGTSIIDPNLSLTDQLNKLTLDMSTVSTPITFTVTGEIKDLSLNAKEALFMTTKPALENILKHAAAQHAFVRLEGMPDCVKLEICDDGKGFDVGQAHNNPDSGMGLFSMKERLKAMGGELTVASSPDDGTCLVATLPYC